MCKDLLVALSPRSCWRFLTLLLRWRLVSLRLPVTDLGSLLGAGLGSLLVTDLGSLLGAGLPLLLLLVSASSPVQTLLSGPGKEASEEFFIVASSSSYTDNSKYFSVDKQEIRIPRDSTGATEASLDCILEALLLAAWARASSGSRLKSDLKLGSAPNSAEPSGCRSCTHSLDCAASRRSSASRWKYF